MVDGCRCGSLATQEAAVENLEVIKVIPEERTPEHIVERTVEIAESSEAGSSWFGKKDTTSTASTEVAKSVSGAQTSGIAKYGTTSADATAFAKLAGEARLPGTSKHSASTESELVVSSGEAGPFWSRAKGTTRQQSQSMLMKVGHLGLRSTAPRRNPNSHSFLMKWRIWASMTQSAGRLSEEHLVQLAIRGLGQGDPEFEAPLDHHLAFGPGLPEFLPAACENAGASQFGVSWTETPGSGPRTEPARLSLSPATGGHVADGPRPPARGAHPGTTR